MTAALSPFAVASAARAAKLARGVHVQIYVANLVGHTHAERMADWTELVQRAKADGFVGVIAHAPGSLLAARELASYVLAAGLQFSVAIGLGEYNSVHPLDAARAVAQFAGAEWVTATIIDAEHAWRNATTDKNAAHVFTAELRRICPNACLVGQWVPELLTEQPSFVNFGFRDPGTIERYDILAPMEYVSYSDDARRADVIPHWVEDELKVGEKLGIEQSWQTDSTFQSYRWSPIEHKLVDVMLHVPGGVVLAWAENSSGGEPYPDESFLTALCVILRLRFLGYNGPDAVREFQVAWNIAHPNETPLIADGWAGAKTRAALGL